MSALVAYFNTCPRWVWMWLLAATLYAGCKLLTLRGMPTAPRARVAGYLLAWPGLNPAPFLKPNPVRALAPSMREWLFAFAKILLGLTLFFVLPRHLPTTSPYMVAWSGMLGLIFILHFGLFHLLSCAWRQAGIEATPLMHWPIAATSVSDFWGKRWNIAFRDLTHRFLFRPLATRWPAPWAMGAVFLFSGIIHDLVVSLPSGGGYGGPTLFFAIQGGALMFERSRVGRKLGLGHAWRGWAFAMLVLLAPLCLLFHPPFAHAIILPMMRDCGALP